MLRRILVKFLIFFSTSVLIVSYFEKPQIVFFTPIKKMLFVPKQIVQKESGIILPKDMPYKPSKDGYYVNPWQASSLVFNTANKVLNSDCNFVSSNEKNKLVEFAHYFRDTAEIREFNGLRFSVWPYPISFTYGVRPGWISGMAQGNVAVLLAAASMCADEPLATSFYEYAKMAITSFDVTVENGGVLVPVDGGNWYEEYAQNGITPPLVLNGHIYALIAIDTLRNFDKRAERLFECGLNAVIENIHNYDMMTWSYYDHVGSPANNYYQRLHARQMKILYGKTGEKIFLSYHRKFSVQRMSPFSSLQRLILNPSRFLVFLLVIDTAMVWGLSVMTGHFIKMTRTRKRAN